MLISGWLEKKENFVDDFVKLFYFSFFFCFLIPRYAVHRGYWKDDYIQYFAKVGERKAPEISRGRILLSWLCTLKRLNILVRTVRFLKVGIYACTYIMIQYI